MNTDDVFAVVYFAVFAAVALGGWLFTRRLDPKRLKYWQPRLSVLSIIVLGSFLVFPVIQGQVWFFLIFLIPFFAWSIYYSIAKVRVCEGCGAVQQPQDLITTPQFCSKCGTKLSAASLKEIPPSDSGGAG